MFQNIRSTGTERIVNIVKTGEPASRPEETKHIITTEES